MQEGVDRRGFLKIVGVSSAAAAAAGCGRGTEALLPYVVAPDHLVPGVPNWYATVCRECPAGCGVLAKNRDGRVVKLEGNPDHPVNHGALCARGQATMLGAYDPDRVPRPLAREGTGWNPLSVVDAEALLVGRVAAARHKGPGRVAMITQLETGSLGRLMDDWLRVAGGRPRIAHEPFALEATRAANRATFGLDAIPYHAFEDAKAVLSLGADYLETWLSPVGYAGGFGRMHAYRGETRGIAIHVEPRYSMTAAAADEWVMNRPGTEGLIALALLRIVIEERLNPPLRAVEAEILLESVRALDIEAVVRQSGVPLARLRQISESLAARAPSLVVGGGVAVSGPGATDAAIAVNLLNFALGNVGQTVRFGPNSALGQASPYVALRELTGAMANGEIDVLVLKDANPLFTLPAKAGFQEALARVPFVVSLSSHMDETTARAHLLLPDLTPLESWGDYSPRMGVWGLMQPAMATVPEVGPGRTDALELVMRRAEERFPGVATKAAGDVLLATGRALVRNGEPGAFAPETFADYLAVSWQTLAQTTAPGVPFATFWEDALRRGGVFTEVAATKVALQPQVVPKPVVPSLEGPAEEAALLVVPSARFYDGRSANKGWLHETPDPMSQLVHDGWVELSVDTARQRRIRMGDVVRITSSHGHLELPVYVSECIAPQTVAIPTGLGHAEYGRFAKGIGANPMALLPGDPDPVSGGPQWLSVRVTVEPTGRRSRLATPAGVTDVDHQREIIETISLKDAVARQQAGEIPAHANLPSMYPDIEYPQYRWGLVVDLDSCIGCQACVVACQAENNIPLVGKDDIDYGRSLHWLRVERWWDRGHAAVPEGEHAVHPPAGRGVAHAAEAVPTQPPQARFMPMMCQHCEVAPCEPVCPVFAAYHTKEGLNAQIYNRCVGTRYCGNNCPYMVRRFNWTRYDWPPPMTLQLNPDVTVRDRGVMEKCTMCVQRIIAGKDRARTRGHGLRDGEILTACQQTCPTHAIVFGDLKEGESQVSTLARSTRGYHALGELGTRPAVTYLRKVLRVSEPEKST